METFKQEHPGEGAEILLRWARNAVECWEGAELPATLTESSLSEWLKRFDFAGPRLRTGLHFGLAAVVVGTAEEEKGLVEFLADSLGDRPEFPREGDWAALHLVALGIVVAPEVASWLERSSPIEERSLQVLAERVTESRKAEAVSALFHRIRKSAGAEFLAQMARECAQAGLAEASLEILNFLAPDQVDDRFLSYFLGYLMGSFTSEQIDRFEEMFAGRSLSDAGLKTARACASIEAGKFDESKATLEGLSPGICEELSTVAGRRAVAEMDRGNFETGLAIFEDFNARVYGGSGCRARWTAQIFDHYDLEQAVPMSLRIPGKTLTVPVVAAALVECGEIDKAEELTDGKAGLDKADVLLAMLKAARSIPRHRERAGRWLAVLEKTLAAIEFPDSLRAGFMSGKLDRERQRRVEQWYRGDRESLERYLAETLVRRDELLASDGPDDDFGADVLTAMMGLAFAETRQFDRLEPILGPLYAEDDIGNVTEAVFENWEPDTDCDRLLQICRDPEDYHQQKFLVAMATHLAETGEMDRARAVAEQLRELYEEEDGFEAIAKNLRDRGDYEGARKMGGAPSWRSLGDPEPRQFTVGVDDEIARDWITAVKGWEGSPEWLVRYGGFSGAREAVKKLIRLHLRHALPWWLTTTDDEEANPNYPRDFPGICRQAKEQAKYEIWREGKGPAPRTPFLFTFLIWNLEALSWFLDRFAGTRINDTEKKIMRQLEMKQESARQKLDREVPVALEMPAGEERFKVLYDLAEIVSGHDEVSAPEGLTAGLRSEADGLRTGDGDEPDRWNRLAVAMQNAGDAGSAAEAWTEYAKTHELGDSRVLELAEKVRKEDWPKVAPMCAANPLAAATLAAKLAKWYPKAGIRIG